MALKKLPTAFGYLACLLPVFLPPARATLTITVPEDTIQAKPGSDVLLPCYIEESSGNLDPKRLAVIWRVGSKVIARYKDGFEAMRPGAKMTPEELKKGNASLLLPDVQDTDSNTYTCFVIHSLDIETRALELKVEAPPLIKLGSTKVQLAKPSMVACTATDFYPGNISVTWLRNNKIVQGPELPPAQPGTDHLFRVESVLKLTPQITDANANFSCHIHHQAIEGPLALNFQLQLQAPPTLQLLPKPPGEKFVAAECNVSNFYPSQIHTEWLHNGVSSTQIKSEVHRMPNGMFSINSVLFPQKSDVEVTYVCRAEHEALEAPLEQSVVWRPEGEGDGIIHSTLPSTQSTRNKFSPSSSWSTVTHTTPSDQNLWLLVLATVLAVVFGFAVGAGTMYCKYKVKNTSLTGTCNERMPLPMKDEETVHDISKTWTKVTSGKSVNPEDFHGVEEQRL